MSIMQSVRRALDATQIEMAEIAGVSQGTVSRWEAGFLEPDRQALERIRTEALRRGVDWDDAIFFAPSPKEGEAA